MKKTYTTPLLCVFSCETIGLMAGTTITDAAGHLGAHTESPESYGVTFGTSEMSGDDMYSKGSSFGDIWDD